MGRGPNCYGMATKRRIHRSRGPCARAHAYTWHTLISRDEISSPKQALRRAAQRSDLGRNARATQLPLTRCRAPLLGGHLLCLNLVTQARPRRTRAGVASNGLLNPLAALEHRSERPRTRAWRRCCPRAAGLLEHTHHAERRCLLGSGFLALASHLGSPPPLRPRVPLHCPLQSPAPFFPACRPPAIAVHPGSCLPTSAALSLPLWYTFATPTAPGATRNRES